LTSYQSFLEKMSKVFFFCPFFPLFNFLFLPTAILARWLWGEEGRDGESKGYLCVSVLCKLSIDLR
jgi:hypothetical protein